MTPEVKKDRTQIMTIPEIAKYLGVHPMTIYRLAKNKELPMFKIGGQWRARKDNLDSFLVNQCAETISG